MDSNSDMMIRQLIQDETTYEEENLMVISCLLCLRAKINAPPPRRGSRKGKMKNNDQQEMQGAVMRETNYFIDTYIYGIFGSGLGQTKSCL
jgi:hypothetical protein